MTVSFQESLEKALLAYWEDEHPGEGLPANFKAFISEAAAEPPKKPATPQSGARGARALANTSVGASMPIVSEVVGAEVVGSEVGAVVGEVHVIDTSPVLFR